MYNILSLLLGIFSLVFSIHSLRVRGCLTCCTLSGFCCALALLLQLADMDLLARAMDASALYDTAHARSLAGTVLLACATGMNLLALLRGKHRRSR